MKIIQYGLLAGLMMASMMPVAQAGEISPTLGDNHQITFTDSLPTITVANKILVTPAPMVTLSRHSSDSGVLVLETSTSESNTLAGVEINGQSVQQVGPAQVIFHSP